MNKQEQCLRGELREQGIASGIDVEALDKEFQEVGRTLDEAEKIIKERRGWLKNAWITFWENFPIPQLGYTNPEVQKEWDRLNKISRRKE